MLFNSMAFAIFLTIVFLLYWLCPSRFRFAFLLAVSYYFYMSLDVKYVFLLLGTSLLSYVLALYLEKAKTKRQKKGLLAIGILSLLSVLIVFKYLGFAFELLESAAKLIAIPMQAPAIQFMLPVGISFYIFQTVGYLIDVYRGNAPAERHLGHYCLFVSFFPQLLSGPIPRAKSLIPQLKSLPGFDPKQAAYGLKLMAVGYFKKLVIANSFAVVVDSVYDFADSYVGLVFLIVTIMFAIQIYCDFSGYSDIAIGTAKLFGIELACNFKSPYFSCNIKEFWGRWHISLSSWFRDYLYFPLGGSRVGRFRHCLNLVIVFLVSGLWHGAGINYIIWGAIHGVYQVIYTLYRAAADRLFPARKKRRSIFGMILTFCAVCFAWIFFRADTIGDAIRVITYIPFDIARFSNYLKTAVISLDMSYGYIIYLCIPVILLTLYDYASTKTDVIAWFSARKAFVRYPVYVLFLLVILLFAEKGVSTEFYYFQF